MQLMFKEIINIDQYIEIIYLKLENCLKLPHLLLLILLMKVTMVGQRSLVKFLDSISIKERLLDYFVDNDETRKNIAEDLSEGNQHYSDS